MTKTKRAILLVTAALLALAVLGGCGTKKEEPAQPAAAETALSAAEETAQPATEEPASSDTEEPPPSAAAEPAELPKETKVGFYLDTVITLTAYTDRPELLEKGLEMCGEYEKMLSRTMEGSDVWKINHAEGKTVTVSGETAEILRTAVKVGELSGGAFDITVAPASTLWNFTSGEQKIPSEEELAEAAKKIDYTKIRIDGNDVTLPEGMMIDLGGIAKGYIADAVKKALEEAGIRSAILSFGGNIVSIGLKPDGSPWKVGIQDIDEPTGTTMMVSLNFGGSTVTSGIYERGFTVDGVTYHHILSSETGWPVQNELASVTIFSDSSMMGDALSTAVFALGTAKGAQLIESLDGTEALFIARDRSASGTSGIGQYMAEDAEYTLIPAAEAESEPLVLQIQVRETDPAPGYILLQGESSMGFIPLPAEGEKTQVILQKHEDGTEWRNVIRMTPEGFCMTESDCEGHDCIEEGEVTLENMKDRLLMNMVICAPHRLTLSLYTPEEAAEISRQWLGY